MVRQEDESLITAAGAQTVTLQDDECASEIFSRFGNEVANYLLYLVKPGNRQIASQLKKFVPGTSFETKDFSVSSKALQTAKIPPLEIQVRS